MHDAAFWSVAEPAVAITICCIATLRPLLKIVSPARFWTSNKGSSANRGGYIGSDNDSRHKKARVMFGVEHDEYPLTRIEEGVTDTIVTRGDDGG